MSEHLVTTADPHVAAVMRRMDGRSRLGIQKYQHTTASNPLELVEWLRHAQEEAMDLAIYLERIISDLPASAAATPTPTGAERPVEPTEPTE